CARGSWGSNYHFLFFDYW
nr:immunoglobulin heavy chain junction region [Macaca mulatta]MOV38423.1 immunoglobulin heavy chain junction region [Macaca mulatta]MOV38977.1 immunoglobulin heavy chain junction region [Macaca mulatta]MOV39335.1 immunoglobulin heavy chain junction region [Macaca mulatta]MOV40713.1 immunoglobulin heavy chain junction region [Macaca mulatta]